MKLSGFNHSASATAAAAVVHAAGRRQTFGECARKVGRVRGIPGSLEDCCSASEQVAPLLMSAGLYQDPTLKEHRHAAVRRERVDLHVLHQHVA